MTLYEYIVFRMTVFFNFIDKEKVKVTFERGVTRRKPYQF